VDLDPGAALAGLMGTVHPLGNDALGAKLARTGEDGRAVLSYVFVQQRAP
jgi:hypothetical protein